MSNKICHTIKHARGHFDDLDDYFDDECKDYIGVLSHDCPYCAYFD